MKRNLSLWLGLAAFALLPALAQTPAPTGKIHGQVINPTGAPQSTGSVSLSNDSGRSSKYTFQVTPTGDYSGEAAPGTYVVIFRQVDTPPDKMVDSFEGVKIVAGQDVLQDIDMSRKEFIDKLPADVRKSLEDIKKHNAEANKLNEIIKGLNADLHLATQDVKDAEGAHATAVQSLGATASKADVEAKETEIKSAKYTEIETLMLKDTSAKPDASVLWAQLGQGQLGLAKVLNDQKKSDDAQQKFADAETSYKKVLELEAASKKPNPSTQGAANAGLGEIYARTGKIPEATAAYDAAATINPAQAGFYMRNEAVIFFQVNNGDAQVAAADKAILADPAQPLPYYLKGQGLVQKATIDAKSGKIVLPPGCADAFQKYLELAPTGQFAADAKGILDQAGQKINSTYKAGKK